MKIKSILLLFSVFITSCSGYEENEFRTESISIQQDSRASSTKTWFDCEECRLSTGEFVNAPWANSVTTVIPDDIRKDVRLEDGWRILYANVTIKGYDHIVHKADAGNNYILFYNVYTGLLKGYCYVKDVAPNNNIVWLLDISTPTKLFNFASYFSEAMDSKKSPNQILLTAITRENGSLGIHKGWNCFQVELAYDENSMNQELSISAYSMNKTNFQLSGSLDGKIDGNITAVKNSGNNFFQGVVTHIGKYGSEEITKKNIL